MPGNSFGQLFRITTFGESHGAGIGCIIDGCPPGLPLAEADIQPDLDRRRPGPSRHVTQRREADQVEILSGVFEGAPPARPLPSSSATPTNAAATTATLPNNSAPAMPTTPIGTNTASATIAAAAGAPPAKPPPAWLPAPWPKNGCASSSAPKSSAG